MMTRLMDHKGIFLKVGMAFTVLMMSACASSQKGIEKHEPITLDHSGSTALSSPVKKTIEPKAVGQDLLLNEWRLVNGQSLSPKCVSCEFKVTSKQTPLGTNYILSLKSTQYEWIFFDLSSRRQSYYPWNIAVKGNGILVSQQVRNKSVNLEHQVPKRLDECKIELLDFQPATKINGVEDSNDGFKLQVFIECYKPEK